MALESGTYINSLVATNPAATDALAAADDHMRLIKSTIKNTFPNIDAAITATEDELNILDGATLSTSELNTLTGITSTTAELNILSGVTSTSAELNKLDGFTGTVADLNYAKDLRATGVTGTEFDYLDGVTSAIQTQLDALTTSISAVNTYPQVITIRTSGNYTIPSNAKAILIRASGAGGSGAVRHGNNSAANGNAGTATTVVNTTLSINISAVGGLGGEQPTSLDHKYSDQVASATGDTIRGAGAQGGRPRNSEFDISAYEGLNGALVQQYITGSSIQSEVLTISYGTGGAGVTASGLTSEDGQDGFVEITVW
jgi:hypothetical protein